MSNSRDTEIGTNMSETPNGEGTMDPSNQSNKNKDQILDTPLDKEKGRKVSSRMLSRLRKSIRVKPGPKSKQEAEQELKTVYEEHKPLTEKQLICEHHGYTRRQKQLQRAQEG